MNWLFFSLTTAFSLATADALTKRALKQTDESVMVWVREGYALPFISIALLFIPIPFLDKTFWTTLALLLPLEITAIFLYVKAIRLSPLSLTIPFMALSPAFILLIAFVILGEVPSVIGVAGVFLITFGAYLLNASASREGILGPLMAILTEKGSVLMIIVAFIYSITSTLGKMAVKHSSPVFFGFFYPLVLTAVLTVVLGCKGKLKGVSSRPGTFLSIGFFTAVMVLSHFIAISLTNVAYMISVKRTNLVFSVLYGRFMFEEENLRERLAGSAIMVIGVVLITLG